MIHVGPKPFESLGYPQLKLFAPSINRYIPTAVAFPKKTIRIHYPL